MNSRIEVLELAVGRQSIVGLYYIDQFVQQGVVDEAGLVVMHESTCISELLQLDARHAAVFYVPLNVN